MKILLLGNTGQLGWELERSLQPLGEVIALDYPAINMADTGSIRKVVRQYRPEMIINATAYTAVDQAESEPELAETINGRGPGILAEEARKINAFLIHYSTDYVFDGMKGIPYTEIDPPNPLNAYGLSKLHGEEAIQQVNGNYLIFRTSWVYSLRNQNNFVNKVLEWAHQQKTLRIVDDQIANPTWGRMLAETTALLLARAGDDYFQWLIERKGLYHLAGDGFASRFEWAKEIIKLDPKAHERVTEELLTVSTTEFPAPAVRPRYSALDCKKFKSVFSLQLTYWEQALALAMNVNKN
jgi:dTDP-4-dehydrorhamnose reductase